MKLFIGIFSLVVLAVSCKTGPNSDKQYAGINGTNVFQLRLNPAESSQYHYDISSQTEIHLEVDDKKVDNINKTDVGANYDIGKDSAGNYLLNIKYDKIHLYTKNGENEKDIDADNSGFSMDPVEKMLGVLKDAKIVAIVNTVGESKSVTGYKELGEKIIEGMNAKDMNEKNLMQSQWDKAIGEGIVKKNVDQLFKMFPDSAVHVGDKWKLNSTEEGDFKFNIKNFF